MASHLQGEVHIRIAVVLPVVGQHSWARLLLGLDETFQEFLVVLCPLPDRQLRHIQCHVVHLQRIYLDFAK